MIKPLTVSPARASLSAGCLSDSGHYGDTFKGGLSASQETPPLAAGGSFERHEKKYLITRQVYKELLPALYTHMEHDTYGVSHVCSLYLDTPDRKLIRTSLQNPVYKEKIRMRSYGICDTPESPVFFELKKKYRGVVYKRRVSMTVREAIALINRDARSAVLRANSSDQAQLLRDMQILRELEWTIAFYAPLMPAMVISCDRLALYGIDESDLRITFDANVRWSDENLTGLPEEGAFPLFSSDDTMIMEIKFCQTMPLWLARLLATREIVPQSFSKYGTAYQLSAGCMTSRTSIGG